MSIKNRISKLESSLQVTPEDDRAWLGALVLDESEPEGIFNSLERWQFLRESAIVGTGKDHWGPPPDYLLATANLPRERPTHLADFLSEGELQKLIKPEPLTGA